MAKYRKKPVVIDAFQMGIDSRPDWFNDQMSTNAVTTHYVEEKQGGPFNFEKTYCMIKTLEGTMKGDYGDYIIKGVSGELYPCKPDIFLLTYEKVAE